MNSRYAEQSTADPRTAELTESLSAVERRITRAVEAAGREQRPELIVVTKYFPAEDVIRLYDLGVRDVGENKDQEASAKAREVAQALRARDAQAYDADPLRWHFIGQLQSNKAKSVAGYAHAVHSVDRGSLLKGLKKVAAERAEPLGCLIQVDLREQVEEGARGGAAPEEVPALAAGISEAQGLRLAGLMAVAPLEEPAEEAFARLSRLHAELLAEHPQAGMVSAGMSGDLEQAVAHGATHLRIGRDVLGERPYPR